MTSGLYYKHLMIVNYDSSAVNKFGASLTDDPRVVIYNCHTFIVQATVPLLVRLIPFPPNIRLG
jgi:hypothetical protein